MLKKILNIKNKVKRLRQDYIIYDIEPCRKILQEINKENLEDLSDIQLKEMSGILINKARCGVPLEELLVKAYAVAREAAARVLKMRPFDVQVLAGIAMHYCSIAEMQTGEGKTLAAVLPAYLNALNGKGVHVLTFNDYLARRDAEWMGPVYEFLGLTVGYINEGMSISQRQAAYRSDITYLTAKEAGFDYLKGFLCSSPYELVQTPFNFAIIDEADSILIDEARIPLVIAGKTETDFQDLIKIAEIMKKLEAQVDYDFDEYERNVYLNEKGLAYVEKELECDNLYDDKNISLLVQVNNALHAHTLLKRDIDYIVRDGKIELVDEFTGRVAENRHWPYGLQEAIEAKEGILPGIKGKILASITLQNFVKQYPRICGMTGTAVSAAEELKEFYGLNVVVIPTNKPCIRIDHDDFIFTHKEAKYKALVDEIKRVHQKGRPILIGTCSVEESELLAGRLNDAGIECNVLNAKNDEEEAKIIARAGILGAVTVSTNMAGRGTDIKLGGENGEEKKKIEALGGLYVIGTNRHESLRIDNQLRGRAGRQGDPGSTRFFISLEDDLIIRFGIKNMIPKEIYPEEQDAPIDNAFIRRQILHAQRIIQGQNFDIRKTLCKYSVIMEQQRQIIYKWRYELLTGRAIPCIMKRRLPERYMELCKAVGEKAVVKAEKQVTMHFLNTCWSDYLDYMSYIRESIHLVNISGKVPVFEFNKIAVEAFDKLHVSIEDEIVNILSMADITPNGIDMEKEGLKAPSSTWTYLVDDRAEQLGITPICMSTIAAAVAGPLLIVCALYMRFFAKKDNKDWKE